MKVTKVANIRLVAITDLFIENGMTLPGMDLLWREKRIGSLDS